MRELTMNEVLFVSGGKDGCPPPRETDLVECAQGIGKDLNDLNNLRQRLVTAIVDIFF